MSKVNIDEFETLKQAVENMTIKNEKNIPRNDVETLIQKLRSEIHYKFTFYTLTENFDTLYAQVNGKIIQMDESM